MSSWGALRCRTSFETIFYHSFGCHGVPQACGCVTVNGLRAEVFWPHLTEGCVKVSVIDLLMGLLGGRFPPWRGARKQPISLKRAFPLLNGPFSDIDEPFP